MDHGWLDWIVQIFGCWCCNLEGIENRAEDILPHHIAGKVIEHAHLLTIPLCDGHHSRYKTTGFHYNETAWCEKWCYHEDMTEFHLGLKDPQERVVAYLHDLRAANFQKKIWLGPKGQCLNPVTGELYEVAA
jgi:hypothetical protein